MYFNVKGGTREKKSELFVRPNRPTNEGENANSFFRYLLKLGFYFLTQRNFTVTVHRNGSVANRDTIKLI